ncbi:MAG: aminotransferase class V-fold PLP-dependent enzyme, partial [Ardenticatenaceae bacterium]
SKKEILVNQPIYLDNAATTYPKPPSVYTEADRFYRRDGGNAGRGGNPMARACARLLAETRALLATWLHAPAPETVLFTSSATHALNLAIFGAHLRSHDTIYVTPFEHNSVLRPIEQLRQTKGIQVRQIPFSRHTYTCQFDKLKAAFQSQPPAMVCVTQASNVCGVMPPVEQIAQLAKAINPQAIIIVDGAQTAGLYPLPLDRGLIDAFIFSGHKSLYGPYGIAGLVLATKWRPAPLFFGGTGTISERVQMPTNLPSAYEAGSHNIWAVAGLKAALEWLIQTGRDAIVEQTMNLAHELRSELDMLPNIDLYAPPIESGRGGVLRQAQEPGARGRWCGILSFTVEYTQPQAIEAALGAQDIAVRAGLHCAPWVHEWMGTLERGGTVRVSTGYFNNAAEVGQLSDFISMM